MPPPHLLGSSTSLPSSSLSSSSFCLHLLYLNLGQFGQRDSTAGGEKIDTQMTIWEKLTLRWENWQIYEHPDGKIGKFLGAQMGKLAKMGQVVKKRGNWQIFGHRRTSTLWFRCAIWLGKLVENSVKDILSKSY